MSLVSSMALGIKLQLVLENYVLSYTSSMFAVFLNTESRGKNFKWEEFPDLVARMSVSQLPLSVEVPPNHKHEAERLVYQWTFQRAIYLVEEAGIYKYEN